jgi:hypothetical protein
VASYSSSYEANEALKKAQADLKTAKANKDKTAVDSLNKEIKNIKLVLSKFPKAK